MRREEVSLPPAFEQENGAGGLSDSCRYLGSVMDSRGDLGLTGLRACVRELEALPDPDMVEVAILAEEYLQAVAQAQYDFEFRDSKLEQQLFPRHIKQSNDWIRTAGVSPMSRGRFRRDTGRGQAADIAYDRHRELAAGALRSDMEEYRALPVSVPVDEEALVDIASQDLDYLSAELRRLGEDLEKTVEPAKRSIIGRLSKLVLRRSVDAADRLKDPAVMELDRRMSELYDCVAEYVRNPIGYLSGSVVDELTGAYAEQGYESAQAWLLELAKYHLTAFDEVLRQHASYAWLDMPKEQWVAAGLAPPPMAEVLPSDTEDAEEPMSEAEIEPAMRTAAAQEAALNQLFDQAVANGDERIQFEMDIPVAPDTDSKPQDEMNIDIIGAARLKAPWLGEDNLRLPVSFRHAGSDKRVLHVDVSTPAMHKLTQDIVRSNPAEAKIFNRLWMKVLSKAASNEAMDGSAFKSVGAPQTALYEDFRGFTIFYDGRTGENAQRVYFIVTPARKLFTQEDMQSCGIDPAEQVIAYLGHCNKKTQITMLRQFVNASVRSLRAGGAGSV